MDEGWVIELGTGESRGGSKPVFFGLNPDARYILGIDITRKDTRVNIFNLQNRAIAETLQIDIELDNAPETFIILKNEVDKFIIRHKLERKKIFWVPE
jgi:N-acetylglucosamine repressor